MESDDLSFCLNRTAQHCWGEIVNWFKGHREIPAVRELTKNCGKILKTAELTRIGPVHFMKLVTGVVAHIGAGDHFVVFCVVRIVQEYCTGDNTSTVIEPFVIAFVEQLLFFLHNDHSAEDIKNIFGSVSDVISWLLRARPRRLEAYLKFLLEVVCSAETPLEVGRAVLSFVNQRLEMLARDQRSVMRCCLQPQLPGLLQLLHDCGDYDVQTMVVECFFRLSTHQERPALAAKWLPTAQLRRAFVALVNFDPDCRLLLNELNQQQGALRRVHSFPAESVLLSEYRLQRPSDPAYRHFWVDFNEGSGMVMVYCQQPVTDTQADDSLWATVMIYRRDVLRARLRLEASTQTLRLTLTCSCRDLLSSAALDNRNGNVVTMTFTKEHSLHSVLGRLYGNAYKFQACDLPGSGRQKCSEGIQPVPCRPAAAFSATASASVGTAKASVPVSGISVSQSTSAPVVAAAETPGRRSDVPKSSVVKAPQRVGGAGRGRSPAGRYRQLEMSSPGAELRRPEVTATPAESVPVSQSSVASVIQPSQPQTVAPSAPRTPSAASKPTTPRSDIPQMSKPGGSQVITSGRQRRERSAAHREPVSAAAETGESAGTAHSAPGGDGDVRASRHRRGARRQYCELSSSDGEGAELLLAVGTERVSDSDLNNNNICQAAAPKLPPRDTQRDKGRRRGVEDRPADQSDRATGAAGSKRNNIDGKSRATVKTKAGRRGTTASPKKAKKQSGNKANVSRLRIAPSSSAESEHFWSGKHRMVYNETETETSAPRLRVRKRARTSRSPQIFSDIGASTVSESQPDPPDKKGGGGTFKRHQAGDPTRLRNKELLTQPPPRQDTKSPRGRGRGGAGRKRGRGAVAQTDSWTSRVQRSPLRSPETLRDEPAPRTSERAAAELVVSPQSKRDRTVALAAEWEEEEEEEAAPRLGAQQTAELPLDVIPNSGETAVVPDPTSAVATVPEVAAAAAEISVSLRESAPSVLCPPNTPAAASASAPRAPRPAAAPPADSPPRGSTQEFLLDARAGDAEPLDAYQEDAAGAAACVGLAGAVLASAPAAESSHPEQVGAGPGGAAPADDSLLGTVAAVRWELAHLDRQDSDLQQLQQRSVAALEVLLEQQTAALTTLQQLSAAATTARERAAERVLAECQRLEGAAAATDQPAEPPLVPAHGLGELADIQRELLRMQRHLR